MQHFDIVQNTDAWMKARGGLATTSSFSKIITPSGAKSRSMDGYANQVVTELLLGKSVDRDLSNIYAIQWGNEYEDRAADLYQFETGHDLKHGGFYCDDHFKRGASPDAIVMENGEEIGLTEIKCPEDPTKHVEFLFRKEINPIYKPQLFGQMHVTGFDWVDWLSFYPELPHVRIKTEKSSDLDFYNKMVDLLDEFDELVQKKLQAMVDCGHINEKPVKFIKPIKPATQPADNAENYMAG